MVLIMLFVLLYPFSWFLCSACIVFFPLFIYSFICVFKIGNAPMLCALWVFAYCDVRDRAETIIPNYR